MQRAAGGCGFADAEQLAHFGQMWVRLRLEAIQLCHVGPVHELLPARIGILNDLEEKSPQPLGQALSRVELAACDECEAIEVAQPQLRRMEMADELHRVSPPCTRTRGRTFMTKLRACPWS